MRPVTSVIAALGLLVSLNWQARADLLVASFDTGQILRYDDTTGAFVGTFATGLPDDHPLDITVGPDGNLYVGVNNFAQGSFIRRFDGQTGAFIGTFTSGGDLSLPTGLAFGPDGNLYVASFGPFEESKVIRYDGFTGDFIDDFVPVGSGGLRGATSLIFGPDGDLYVTSRITNQILRYDGSTGSFLNIFASGGNNGPQDLTFGPNGDLFVLYDSPQKVDRFVGLTGEFLGPFATGSWGTDGIKFTFGPDGNLYVTTGLIGNSVLRFHGSTGQFIDTFVSSSSGGLSFATGLAFLILTDQLISLDIKPDSFPNIVNLKSQGVIPVSILTTQDFDATTVDPLSVEFGPQRALETHGRGHIEDVNGDGKADLLLHFRIQDTAIKCGDAEATLIGETFDGQEITGSDPIETVGCEAL